MSARTTHTQTPPAIESIDDDVVHWVCCIPDSRLALCGVVVRDIDPDESDVECGTCNEINDIDDGWVDGARCTLCPHNILGGAS